MQFTTLPVPAHLQPVIECITLTEYTGTEQLAIHVCLNGLPGIVFQHHHGHSPIDHITTPSGSMTGAPTLYVYGQMTQPGIMQHKQMPFTSLQVVLKPHALSTLLGINAAVITNNMLDLAEFSAADLNMRLLEAPTLPQRISLLTGFLESQLKREPEPDRLVAASLRLIHQHPGTITVNTLLDRLSISERQFERRFRQVVGLAPQFYIRVKRFNSAIQLLQAGKFHTMTEVAHSLNFYDQSHFIRDIRAFSGLAPKNLTHRLDDFHVDDRVYAYL